MRIKLHFTAFVLFNLSSFYLAGQNIKLTLPKSGDYVAPETFGAKGDGIADDRVALQAAFNAAQTTILLSGNYKISGPLIVPSNKKIIGQQSTITAPNRSFFDAIIIKGSKNIFIEGLTIKANDGENAFDKAIYIIDGKNIVIANCTISNIGVESSKLEYGFGILVSGSFKASPSGNFGSENIKILNNTISNIKGYGNARGDFVCIQHSSQVIIENNYFNKCSRQGIAIADFATDIKISNNFILNTYLDGIDIEPDSPKSITGHISIKNNTIRNFGCKPKFTIGIQSYGIDCHANQSNIDIEGNQIFASSDSSLAGINCQSDSYYIRIVNNSITGNNVLKKGISLYSGSGAKSLIIANNIITGFKEYGIDSYKNGTITIIGNQLESTIGIIGIKSNESECIISNNFITISSNSPNVLGLAVFQSGIKRIQNNVVKINSGIAYQFVVSKGFYSTGSLFSDNSAINLGKGKIAYSIETADFAPDFQFINNYSDSSFPKKVLPEHFAIISENGISPPSSGYYVKGSKIYNLIPIENGYTGWICINSGSPGTWKPFGKIAPQ
ncbi:right-handed parallel beta-helix repeat-containing protein [Dyadobacter frigoris]|uniref:Right handed beta helix domain-containing protein n=1 Tax=Dyadobacter frigoris TaxID=2576211 RepID=A0A4U6DA83_9BACT|nr:right-handed parallel beta-helix repeat-containing protein [Dyadobacter frigoris]TKT93291.1 hypothetical protein FDK13_05405 [Dyadobacter frigoris]